MAVTRTVKQASAADLPEEAQGVGFLSNGTDGYGHGEPIAIPDARTFTVTKPINYDQLAYELEQALGVATHLASYQPPPDGDLHGPVPGSAEYPITLYVQCGTTGDEADKTIAKTLNDHTADPHWVHPATTE